MGNSTAKREKLIKEIATKETYLECPVLVDLDHGTIRHRQEETDKGGNEESNKKVGYFYHPKLNDFSEDAILNAGENNRLKYVFQGPQKDTGKRLYYIYGTNKTDHDKGIHHNGAYKPQGKGYNWPQSYRKANNLYYDVTFVEQSLSGVEDLKVKMEPPEHDNDDDNSSVSSGIIVVDQRGKDGHQKDNVRMKLRGGESVGNVIEHLSLHLLIPSSNIHLMWMKRELDKGELIKELNKEEVDDHKVDHDTCISILLRLS